MRLSDGPQEKSSSSDSNSNCSSVSANNVRPRHGRSNKGREKDGNNWRLNKPSRRDPYKVPNPDIPNGPIVTQNSQLGVGIDNPTFAGKADEDFGYDSQIPLPNGFISTGNGRGRSKVGPKPRGKKFPPTPLPLYDSPKREKSFHKKSGSTRSRSDRTPSDMDLVDYDDFGSASSSCSCSSSFDDNEDQDNRHGHFQVVQHQSNNYFKKSMKSNMRHSSKSTGDTDYSKFNQSGELNSGNSNAYQRRKTGLLDKNYRDESGESPGLVYDNNFDEVHDGNAPCSSTSLRERLELINSKTVTTLPNSTRENSSTSKVSRNSKSDNNDIQVVEEVDETNDPGGQQSKDIDVEKYVYSGVGRHFGKKQRSLSSTNLTEDAGLENGMGSRGLGGRSWRDSELFGYVLRLKAASIVFLSTLFILSLSSLLFVFPIIVDPIILGLEAQFSLEPVQCRTTNFRNGKGPTECALPSCRTGCTADIFECIFIDVEYEQDSNSSLIIGNGFNLTDIAPGDNTKAYGNGIHAHSNYGGTNVSHDVHANATLYININGCGYPPEVNCSEFVKSYGSLGTIFECYFSRKNRSVVVPFYNYAEEKKYLLLAICVPLSLAIFSALSLLVLLKFCTLSRNKLINKSTSDLKLLDGVLSNDNSNGESEPSVKSKSHKKLNGVELPKHIAEGTGQYMNGSIPKANGNLFVNAAAGLTGLKSPTDIHNTIKQLPHQHDSFDKSVPYLNGGVKNHSTEADNTTLRKSRYAKRSDKISRGLQSNSHMGSLNDLNGTKNTDNDIHHNLNNQQNEMFHVNYKSKEDKKIIAEDEL